MGSSAERDCLAPCWTSGDEMTDHVKRPAGSDVTLRCPASGNPAPDIS